MRVDRPPLLYSGLFWGIALSNDHEGTVFFPPEYYAPVRSGDWLGVDSPRASLHYSVEQMFVVDGICHADVRLVLAGSWQGEKSRVPEVVATATFRDGVPLPVGLDERVGDGNEDVRSRIRMSGSQVGNQDAQLPSFRQSGYQDSRLPLTGLVNGFLAVDQQVFATSYALAAARMRDHPEFRAWDPNSTARPLIVEHLNGNGPVEDVWEILWSNGGPQGQLARIVAHNRTAMGESENWSLTLATEETPTTPLVLSQAVSMSGLTWLHDRVYDRPIEIIRCDFGEGTCYVSNHADSGRPYEGTRGGAMYHPGLGVWIEQGWVMVDDSLSRFSVGPPVVGNVGIPPA
jgi:hypothetical protein